MSYNIPSDHHGPTPAEAARNIPGRAKPTPRRDFFAELRDANIKRAPDFHAGGLMDWSPAERGNELAGETGELCNELKKLLRFDRKYGVKMTAPGCVDWGLTGGHERARDFSSSEAFIKARDEIVQRVRLEMGDAVICLSLIAAQLDIDIEGATRQKFNITSDKIGSKVTL